MSLWVIIAMWLATLIVITCKVGMRPRAPGTLVPAPRYTLVRICGGPEPHLTHNLTSVLHANGAAPTQVVLVVPHDDPQRAAVDAACCALLARGCATCVVATDVRGANHKVAQMAATFALWPDDDDIVCADGDVDLTDYPMDTLRAALQAPNIAAVWAPCAEWVEAPAPCSAASVLSSSLHCFALLGRLDGGGMVGKLWAVRRACIVRAGGFASLVNTLGEDMELARRFLGMGLGVVMAPHSAWCRPAPRAWRVAVARYTRWFWVIRAQRPHLLVTYPLWLFGTSGVVALCAYQAVWWPWQAGAVACLALLLRLALAAIARRAIGAPYKHLVRDAALSEVTMVAAFVCMVLQRTVRWRHQRLHVQRGGHISRQAPC